VSGKEYIDLCMSFGPLILGHAPEEIVQTLKEAVEKGTSFGTSTPLEVDLAEKIVESHRATDCVRFVNSGTEAVMSAIRLARGATGREIIIKFAGCYHGHVDSMLVKAGSGLATFGISSSKGVLAEVSKKTVVLPLGDIVALESAFEKHSIAAVIIEGVPANNGLLIQTKAFMKKVEELAHKNGALFILDEVITGFRLGLGGATKFYDLNPDIVTFGKVIGGGLPVGAYGGKRELMNHISPLGSVYQAGTLSGNPLAMVAGNKVLDILKEQTVYDKLEKLGKQFEERLMDEFTDLSIDFTVRRVGSIIWTILGENLSPVAPEEVSKEMVTKYTSFHKNALREGVYLPPSAFEVSFLSTAHSETLDELITKLKIAGEKI
ncbi:MAG: glutamate-1-semialdehyde 2,1-aminomutase, partial [Candidatus Heimdallarchaeota archaeon]|nr:glutamate-1-semialdehyde 2,1-aminomutase [Candidatus Heimdallarchaeota archaeon]